MSDQYLSDIIIGAVEGGISYWAMVKNYHWKNPPASVDVKVDERVELLCHVDEKKRTNIWHHITTELILEAMQRIVKGEPMTNKYIIGACAAAIATQDAGDIDGELADVIMQIAVLNGNRYG